MKTVFQRIGKEPLCNGRPERAPHIGSFCFPLCWRCTAISLGAIAMGFFNLSYCFYHPLVGTIVALGLAMPCLADGLLQKYAKKESTNIRRILTGLLAGIGMGVACPVFYLVALEVLN